MLQRKSLLIHVGQEELTVWEANWDMSAVPDRMSQEAQKLIKENDDPSKMDLLSFANLVYPWLAAFTTGKVPALQEAFELPDDDLDNWYLAVRETNPHLFNGPIPEDHTVQFRDGSSFCIKSAFLPSSLRRLIHIDNQAIQLLVLNPSSTDIYARMKVYGKMACCSRGDVPTFEQIGDWPATELQHWYEIVLRANPHLFLSAEDLEEVENKKLEEEASKKNSVHARSSSTSQASSRKKRVRTSQV
jgi:hypothetical protein